ncbi:hypothetical protein [uncultured Thermomonospora sp.]|uniref:hypothetical protein n=1 Tax=uncultured Thermomonospora sp. TaxID=671175 RepID=UPI00259B25E1|nr:hypothetical protein [uncultured Thermomonospora sp.]
MATVPQQGRKSTTRIKVNAGHPTGGKAVAATHGMWGKAGRGYPDLAKGVERK